MYINHWLKTIFKLFNSSTLEGHQVIDALNFSKENLVVSTKMNRTDQPFVFQDVFHNKWLFYIEEALPTAYKGT